MKYVLKLQGIPIGGSIGDIDVSAIAKVFGGGGHKNAAGFQMPLKDGRPIVDTILGRNERAFFRYDEMPEKVQLISRFSGGCI